MGWSHGIQAVLFNHYNLPIYFLKMSGLFTFVLFTSNLKTANVMSSELAIFMHCFDSA
jgi:hypothetical protein